MILATFYNFVKTAQKGSGFLCRLHKNEIVTELLQIGYGFGGFCNTFVTIWGPLHKSRQILFFNFPLLNPSPPTPPLFPGKN